MIALKLAFFCEGFTFDSAVAMPWRHIYEIAIRLIKQGNSVSIYTNSVSGLPQTEERDGIIIHRIKKMGPILNIKELSESLNHENFDLINWHSGPLSALYFLRLQNLIKTKIVWSVFKGKLFPQDLMNFKLSDIPTLYRYWNNILCSLIPNCIIRKGGTIPQICKIVTLSDRLKTYFKKIGIDKEHLTTISSGVDTKLFHPMSPKNAMDCKVELGLQENDKVILFFGPVSSPRGTDTVISAMPKILEKFPSAKLILLARTSRKDSTDNGLKTFGQKLSFIQIITGVIEPDLLTKYLGLADVVALPFRFWPYNECPLTILESMAMEKPVISTYAGSISELVKDGKTGCLIPVGNTSLLSHAVIKILTDKNWAITMGKRGRRYVRQFHDWDHITKLTLDVFNEVLNSKKL